MTEATLPLPPSYASFNTRLLASTLELGIVMSLLAPTFGWIMAQLFGGIDGDQIISAVGEWQNTHDTHHFFVTFWKIVVQQRLIERIVVENLIELVCIAAYVLPFWYFFSSTPAKMLFRMQIRDATTGAPMTPRQCVIRFLGYIVSTLPFTLGFVWMLFNKKRQGFHDIMANTVVVTTL